MKCTTERNLLFRKIDKELTEFENAELDAHLAECASCNREYRLLTLPGRIANAIPPVEPSPFFYQKLRTRIDGEAQNAVGWQVFVHLARQVIPALAGITLALLSVFAYIQFTGKEPDLYKAYDRVFVSEDQPHQMLLQWDITDESVLSALAEHDANHHRNHELK